MSKPAMAKHMKAEVALPKKGLKKHESKESSKMQKLEKKVAPAAYKAVHKKLGK